MSFYLACQLLVIYKPNDHNYPYATTAGVKPLWRDKNGVMQQYGRNPFS